MEAEAAKLIGAGLSRQSRWQAPVSASATFSATISPARCATRPPPRPSSRICCWALRSPKLPGLFGLVVALIILFVF
jgi:hypothetical protein